jgi:hypothetical protein
MLGCRLDLDGSAKGSTADFCKLDNKRQVSLKAGYFSNTQVITNFLKMTLFYELLV